MTRDTLVSFSLTAVWMQFKAALRCRANTKYAPVIIGSRRERASTYFAIHLAQFHFVAEKVNAMFWLDHFPTSAVRSANFL